MVGIVDQVAPVLRPDAGGEKIGVIGRMAHHGEHLAVPRIEHHHRAALVLHRQFGHYLKIEVDRKLQVFTGYGGLVFEDLVLVAEVVDSYATLAVNAHQGIVVLALDAVFADQRSLVVLREFGRVQLRFGNFTDVPDDVRCQPILRIEAALSMNQLHLRERPRVAVRLDKGQFGRRQFFLDDDGNVLGFGAEAADPRGELVIFQVETFGDGRQVLHLQVFARQDEAVRVVIIDNDSPVTIEDLAARREDGNRFNAVLLRLLLVVRRVAHLQLPKSRNEEYKNRDREVLE